MRVTVEGQEPIRTVRVPFAVRKRGGRKLVIAPDLYNIFEPVPRRPDAVLVKAVGRAFRWRKELESGAADSVDELANSENINPSFVSRVLRLTLLAPDIIESILNGTQPTRLQLNQLMKPFPSNWAEQRANFLQETYAQPSP